MKHLKWIITSFMSALISLILAEETPLKAKMTRFSQQKPFMPPKHDLSPKIFDEALSMLNITKGVQQQFRRRLNPNPFRTPSPNLTSRREKGHSFTWSLPKDVYRKNPKHLEDYLGLDSKYHELAHRKYVHEHEGFFFPVQVPSHHEKDDHLIPVLLLLLLPLLLFAIIIPLNANLLSTLFLIMQNNGATATLAAAGRRRRRRTPLFLESRIIQVLNEMDPDRKDTHFK